MLRPDDRTKGEGKEREGKEGWQCHRSAQPGYVTTTQGQGANTIASAARASRIRRVGRPIARKRPAPMETKQFSYKGLVADSGWLGADFIIWGP